MLNIDYITLLSVEWTIVTEDVSSRPTFRYISVSLDRLLYLLTTLKTLFSCVGEKDFIVSDVFNHTVPYL